MRKLVTFLIKQLQQLETRLDRERWNKKYEVWLRIKVEDKVLLHVSVDEMRNSCFWGDGVRALGSMQLKKDSWLVVEVLENRRGWKVNP